MSETCDLRGVTSGPTPENQHLGSNFTAYSDNYTFSGLAILPGDSGSTTQPQLSKGEQLAAQKRETSTSGGVRDFAEMLLTG